MTVPETESAPPALFDHCVNTYQAMLSEAKSVVTIPDNDDWSDGSSEPVKGSVIVYEGFLTQLVTSKLNLSVPYYTSIRKALLEMGCVRQLKRGGGTSQSQWELIYEPNIEAFNKAQPKKVPKQNRETMWADQLASVNKRVQDLEGQVEAILEALAEQFGTAPAEE